MPPWMRYSIKYFVDFKFLCHCCISTCEANLTILRQYTHTTTANYKEQILTAPLLVSKFSPYYGTHNGSLSCLQQLDTGTNPEPDKSFPQEPNILPVDLFRYNSCQSLQSGVFSSDLTHYNSLSSKLFSSTLNLYAALNMTHLVSPSYRRTGKIVALCNFNILIISS
jgi:hypothetical protein